MKKLATFASDVRVHALLCCSAAVLLTACGGSSADSAGGQQAQTAGYSQHDSVNASDANVAAAGDAKISACASAVTDQADAVNASNSKSQADDAAQADATPTTTDAAPADTAEPVQAGSAVNISAAASIYNLYVATNGSDSNSGSATSPFKTIQKAASVAKASTTVHVRPGTYYGNISTRNSGTSTGRIRFVSDTKWGAKIVGSGTESMWTNNANYIDIVGFDITGPGRLGILNWGSYASMSGNHVHNLTVTGGCTGNGGAGIMNANYTGSDNDMIGNVVHDIGVPGKCNAVQGLYHANLRGHIFNNLVYRVSSYGIHLWHAANNVMIANNTSFGNGSTSMGGGFVIGTGDSPGGVVLDYTKVINNIAYGNPRVGIEQYCYSNFSCIGSHNTVANNLVYANGRNLTMVVGSATGTITADPKFVNFQANGTGNYRLQSTSPAIDKGLADSAPADDIDNVARPQGFGYDIGAYEFGASTPPPTTTWTTCANEWGTCNFTGTRQVRYGAGGNFATLTASTSIPCRNSVFGDPAPGLAKTCQYADTTTPPTTTETWTYCGAEGATCSFTGTREVRYGASGTFASKIIAESTACKNSVFGDPIVGVAKSCSYSSITH